MNGQYSREAMGAYAALAVSYLVIAAGLWFLQSFGVITFTEVIDGDPLKLLTTLPFTAFYLVVLLAATAGYARGAAMAKELPFSRLLQKKTLASATVKTKLRGGGSLSTATTLLRALFTITTSRLPIMAVTDAAQKVSGVITSHDLIKRIQEDLENPEFASFKAHLEQLTVQDLHPAEPVKALTEENFETVLNTMLQHQLTKLIVVDSKTQTFVGTVDVLDLVGELVPESAT